MRKREKLRISQDIRPWKKAVPPQLPFFSTPEKEEGRLNFEGLRNHILPRWKEGRKRAYQTTSLFFQSYFLDSKIWSKHMASESYIGLMGINLDMPTTIKGRDYAYKIRIERPKYPEKASISTGKHSCFFLGRSRTYNRKLHMARHTARYMFMIGQIPSIRRL